MKYATQLFYGLGGIKRCSRDGGKTPKLVWQFMQQDTKLVAAYVSECMYYRRYFAPDVEFFSTDVTVSWQTLLMSLIGVCVYLGYLCVVQVCPWGSRSTPEGDSDSSLSPG